MLGRADGGCASPVLAVVIVGIWNACVIWIVVNAPPTGSLLARKYLLQLLLKLGQLAFCFQARCSLLLCVSKHCVNVFFERERGHICQYR